MRKTAFPKEVVATLLRNGFTLTRQKGSHAIYTHQSGKWTVVPMHNKELKRATFHTILKQSGLSRDDF